MKFSVALLCLGLSFGQELDKKNVRDCSPEDPCSECQGDCDTDDDCAVDLVCHQRNSAETEEDAVVPGCEGLSYSRTDWCVLPPLLEENVNEEEPIPETLPEVEEPIPETLPEMEVEEPIPETLPEVEEPTPETLHEMDVEGFEKGMTVEIAGLWVGDEKWNEAGDIYDYCSRALFQSSDSGETSYLSWHSIYVENTTDACGDVGIDPLTGGVEDEDYFVTPNEIYLMGVGYKGCLTEAECDYDVTTSEGYEDYEVIAKSCGVHLKENLLSGGLYDCELYQISRVENTLDGSTMDVAILTYGSTWTGGYGNWSCPLKPTLDIEELLEDPNGQGTTLFVLQSGGGANVTDWECLV